MMPEHHNPDRSPQDAWRGGTYDSRIGASIMLVAMSVVLASSLSLPLAAPPIKQDIGTRASNPAPGRSVAEVKENVKIVAASPALEAPCEEQTWPYLDRRCLKDGAATADARRPKATPQREPLSPR
jgi:hypothetical protein